jgi:hypothetical protein
MDGDDKKTDKPTEQPGWQYASDDKAAPLPANPSPAGSEPGSPAVEWSASEFIAHEKGVGWYLILGLVSVTAAALVYLLIRDRVSVVVILLFAVILGIAGGRKPRVVQYRLDEAGLTVGKRMYPYTAYKSFALIDEEPFRSVSLLPMKRFGMPLSFYPAPEDEQKILQVLADHLPVEQRELSTADRLMRQMRF